MLTWSPPKFGPPLDIDCDVGMGVDGGASHQDPLTSTARWPKQTAAFESRREPMSPEENSIGRKVDSWGLGIPASRFIE